MSSAVDQPGILTISGAGGVRLALEPMPAEGEGGGIAILFLHGGGQSRHSWRATARVFAKAGHPCWLADLRGHGDSEWSEEGDYSFDAFRDDVSAYLSAIDAPVVIVGGSQGGISAMLAAGETRHPAIRSLVLVDIAAQTSPDRTVFHFMRAAERGFASAEEAARLVADFTPGAPYDPARVARNLRPRPDGRLGWHWDWRYVGPDAMEQALRRQARMERIAADVDLPVLILRGTESPILTLAAAQDYAARLAHGEALELQGAGHMVSGDFGGTLSGLIGAFLARHGIARATR